MEQQKQGTDLTARAKVIYLTGGYIALATSLLYLLFPPSPLTDFIFKTIIVSNCMLNIYLWKKYFPDKIGSLVLNVICLILFLFIIGH